MRRSRATRGLALDDGIVVDEFGATSDPAIFACGDVANHHNGWLKRRACGSNRGRTRRTRRSRPRRPCSACVRRMRKFRGSGPISTT
uniref:FAD-dependent oxidoreductase n=1 Tax=Burkholderia ambifaria TaxID=152480 RepID=UPI0022350AEE|nr:FAD-dependent oxidoreductase [Burkholderia ambifaria]